MTEKAYPLFIGLTLICLVIFLYLLLYLQTIQLHSVDSFFLMSATAGSFYLYGSFFLQEANGRTSGTAGAIFLVVIALWLLFFRSRPGSWFLLVILLWLGGCVHFLSQLVVSSKNRAATLNYFCLYVSLPLFICLSNYFLTQSGQNHPLVQDELLMAADGTLGVYPSLVMGRFIRALPENLTAAINLLYLTLPFAFILVYKQRQAVLKKPPYEFIIELLLIGIIGGLLYNIIPGCGSRYAFYATWPDGLPSRFLQKAPQPVYCAIELARNCLPSLHMAWIVCMARNAWICGVTTRLLISVLVMGNVVAMFGIGAHYLVDLIAGFAFANGMGGVSATQLSLRNTARRQAIVYGTLLCVFWYLIILYGLFLLQLSKPLAWCVFLGSLLISARTEWNLCQAQSMALKRGGSIKNPQGQWQVP